MLSPLAKVPEESEVLEPESSPAPAAPEAVHPDNEPEEDDDLPLMHPEELEALQRQEAEQEVQPTPEPEIPTDPKIQALLDRIAALESQVAQQPTAQASAQQPADEGIPDLREFKIITDNDDVTDFTLSAEGMNEFGRRAVSAAVQTALRLVQPTIVTEANRAIASYEYSKQFYSIYPDLRDKGDLIAELSEKIEAEDPAVTPQKLFTEVAKRAYAQLGIPMPKSNRKPGFANPTGAVPLNGTPQRTRTTSDEVAELLRHKGKIR